MRFAIDEKGQAIGADEAVIGARYRCAGCNQAVMASMNEATIPAFRHVVALSTESCQGEGAGWKKVAQQQLKSCERIRLPGLSIIVSYPPNQARAWREEVLVTEEKRFTPFGIDLDAPLCRDRVDVLYEAGEWKLGILLRSSREETTRFNLEDIQGSKAGLIEIDLSKIELVSGHGFRTWREQVRTVLGLGSGNKQWLYHPRTARVRRDGEERLERQWRFKHHMASQIPAKEENGQVRVGTPQKYRCGCGEVWMGRAGINSPCPKCSMPSGAFAVAVRS